jgi:hypothetical protein
VLFLERCPFLVACFACSLAALSPGALVASASLDDAPIVYGLLRPPAPLLFALPRPPRVAVAPTVGGVPVVRSGCTEASAACCSAACCGCSCACCGCVGCLSSFEADITVSCNCAATSNRVGCSLAVARGEPVDCGCGCCSGCW